MNKDFFKDKERLILIGILLAAFAIRLYFFFKTYNQALWWDEADYMSLAKSFAFGTPEEAAPWRARGMSLIFALFYMLGFEEIFMRLLEIGASVLGVYLTYLIGKEFYTKKVGLIAAAFMSVFWLHLFWSMRFSMEMYGLLFWGFAAIFFWRGFVKDKNKWYMIASGALIAYGIFAYESVGFIFVFLTLFLLLTTKLKFLANKKFWWGMLGLCVVLGAFFAYNYHELGDFYPRLTHVIEGSLSEGTELDVKLEETGFWTVALTSLIWFQTMPQYLLWIIFAVFLVGVLLYFDMFLGLDLIWKDKSPRLKKDLFIFLWVLSILVVFGLYLAVTNAYYEPRYLFPMYPALFVIAARGTVKLADFAKKHRKELEIIVILAIIIAAAYTQLTYADETIEAKLTSFSQERPAGEWLKENTEEDDVILTCSQNVPLIYYSERRVLTFRYNTTEVDEQILEYDVDYLVLDLYHWDCNVDYVVEREANLTLVQYYTEDDQPAVLIYETTGYG